MSASNEIYHVRQIRLSQTCISHEGFLSESYLRHDVLPGMLILGLGLKATFLGLGLECSGLGIKYKSLHYCLKYGTTMYFVMFLILCFY